MTIFSACGLNLRCRGEHIATFNEPDDAMAVRDALNAICEADVVLDGRSHETVFEARRIVQGAAEFLRSRFRRR